MPFDRQKPALLAILVACLAVAPASASAAMSWSGPIAVDHHGGQSPNGLACPAAGQCTAVDSHGEEVTFDPASPGTPAPQVIDPGHSLSDVDCPSTAKCIAVDSEGYELSFDPARPDLALRTYVSSETMQAVSCPSLTECVAVGFDGVEVTFVPGGSAQSTVIDGSRILFGVSCPSTSECTAVDLDSNELTFEPAGPGSPAVVETEMSGLTGAISCPSTTLCTIDDYAGQEASFDPASPGTFHPVLLDFGHALEDVACPSTSSCVAVGWDGLEVSYDPASPGTAAKTTIDTGEYYVNDVACPSTGSCTALDGADRELTFDPASPGTPDAVMLADGTPMHAVSCPAQSQCTAIDTEGREVTFDPASPAGLEHAGIDPGTFGEFAISCPSTGQCTAVDDEGREVTFDPSSVSSPTLHTISSGVLEGVSCPSAGQCTAVDDEGHEITFDPASPDSHSSASISGYVPAAVSCPNETQCTAVDDEGREITFDPQSPGSPTPQVVDSASGLTAISCPSTSQCTAVDREGGEVSFQPLSPGSPSGHRVVAGGASAYSVSCVTNDFCAIVDSFGEAVEGDPSDPAGFSSRSLPESSFGTAVSCAAIERCVAVDDLGDAYLGSPEASGPSPVRFSIVSSTGLPQYAYYIVLPSGEAPPVAGDWWTAEATATPGEATIDVEPGDTVYFNRSEDVSEKEGTLVPPEGIGGKAYEVTGATPSDVTVTMPSTGSPFHPELSPAEEWVLGQLNRRRVEAGAEALEVSTALSAAASEEARDEAVNHRWPDPYFFAVNQDVGWPGDIAAAFDYAEADAPMSDPEAVLRHWDGDPSDAESPGIWEALSRPSLHYVGIGDGEGAWIIQATDGCPDPGDVDACGLTSDTGDPTAWEPPPTEPPPTESPAEVPKSLSAPAIAGNPVVGEQVTGTPGAWSNDPTKYVYEWQRCPSADSRAGCQTIQSDDLPSSAGSDHYTVGADDYGNYLVLEVKGVSDAGYEVAFSSPVRVQASPPSIDPSHLPSVAGPSQPRVGDVLTASPGQWSGTQPMLLSYGWLRCPDTTIAHCIGVHTDSDNHYTLAQGDVGDRMLLVVTTHNASGQSAKAFAPSFTGVVEESVASLSKAAHSAKTVSGQVGSVSGSTLLAGGSVEIKLSAPQVIDLLGSATLISDKGLGLTQQQVAQLISQIEAGLISDKGLGLIGDTLISDKGLGLIAHGSALASRVRKEAKKGGAGKAGRKPRPLFAGAGKFKHAGKGKIKLRLTSAGRKQIEAYEHHARAARRHGHKPKPLQISLVTVAGPLQGHGDAVFHLRTLVVRP